MSWIRILLRSFSHASHQLTVIVTCHARLSTNSCVMVHGNSHHVGRDNSCMGIHASSRGAIAHGNSRVERGREVSGETKTSSTSTLSGVWRPAVGRSLLYSRRQKVCMMVAL